MNCNLQNPKQFSKNTLRHGFIWFPGLAVLFLSLLAPPQGWSQEASAPLPEFEVASVKPNRSADAENGKGTWKATKGDEIKITIRNTSLRACIQQAFGVKDYQIVGPDWLKSERFDIVATASHASKEQFGPMLQALLKERFKMELHQEPKELPVYTLVVGKNGPKIHEVPREGQAGVWEGVGKLTIKKMSMAQFAEALSRQMDRPVVDKTGLTGVFDFSLDYTRQETRTRLTDEGQPASTPDLGSSPSIFTALQEQLGLKLEGRKEPVAILIIDHAEKEPTED